MGFRISIMNAKIIREEYFPFLVENGVDSLGILLWIDYGHYWTVQLKSEYEKLH